ncbi:L-xylulose reductase-like [Mya arenaria]|uniref:L-xylulose reductase-like n=1 Tax=Mya arenaria TaxID=6604 RepID=UPI0022E3E2DE|nr:L-xylulose reductase-like [Mya arenaria]
MSLNLKGKKFLVTGAGRGIGRELVKALNKEECIVYALNRSKEPLDTLVQELPAVVPLHVDLEDWEATRALLESIEVLDGVVNNAGLADLPSTSVLECSKKFMNKVVDCQVFGAINTMQVVAKKDDRGRSARVVREHYVKRLIEEGSPLDIVFTSRTPCGRVPEVSEVVVPIMYLLSDMSSMVSGTNQVVDGGMLSSFITQL